jgi:hypothetical protein
VDVGEAELFPFYILHWQCEAKMGENSPVDTPKPGNVAGSKYSSSEWSIQYEAALAGAAAMTLATDCVDQWTGGAGACHAAMPGISFACRSSCDANSTMRRRWRCPMLNPCSTGVIPEQGTGVKCTTNRGGLTNPVQTARP